MADKKIKTDLHTNKAIANDKENVTLRKDFIKCWLHANPTVTPDKASKLYDAMCNRFPELTRGGHRGMVGRLNPWETLNHECPCCGVEANGLTQIRDIFGLRLVKYTTKSEGDKRKVYYQSQCRTCRPKRKGGNGNKRINPEVDAFYTNQSDADQ